MLGLLDTHRAVVLQLLLLLLFLHACCTGALTRQQATHPQPERAANRASSSLQACPCHPPDAQKASRHPCSMCHAVTRSHPRTVAPRSLSPLSPRFAGSRMSGLIWHVYIVTKRRELESPHRADVRHGHIECARHRTPIEPRSTQRTRPLDPLLRAQPTEGQS